MNRRGQAYVETVIFVPLFLLLLYGVIWIIQITVLNERGQIAVRYSGLVSNESSPYSSYSFYALYANAASPQPAPSTCATPAVDAYINSSSNSAFPGPSAAPFWQPDGNAVTSSSCTTARITVSGGSLSSPVLLVNTDAKSSVTKTVPAYLTKVAGLSVTTPSAELNFFNTPDLATTLQCYADLRTTINASLAGETAGSTTAVVPTPLPATTSTTTLTNSC